MVLDQVRTWQYETTTSDLFDIQLGLALLANDEAKELRGHLDGQGEVVGALDDGQVVVHLHLVRATYKNII